MSYTTDAIAAFMASQKIDRQMEQQTANKIAPKHYMLGDGLQAIDIIFKLLAMRDCDPFISYCWGNVLKYMMRWTQHDGITDLKKAHRYLTWILEYQETGKITHE